MAFKIVTLDREVVNGLHVLIDADVIAYLGSQGCDELPLNAALAKMKQRWEQVMTETQAETYTGYLTGKDNFRDGIASLQRYKGNRYDKDGNRIKAQPIWLQECRQELITRYGCLLQDGQEADDALGIASYKRYQEQVESEEHYRTIISSIDKDLRINPGMHHNMTTGNLDWVTPFGDLYIEEKVSPTNGKTTKKVRGSGLKFFYAQILMGDTADWIPGLPKVTDWMKEDFPQIRRGGVGPMTAYHLLNEATSELKCHDIVWRCYRSYWMDHEYKHWRTGKLYPAGIKTARKQFIEQARLLWMRKQEGELWESTFSTD